MPLGRSYPLPPEIHRATGLVGKSKTQEQEKAVSSPALPRLSMESQAGAPGTEVVVPLYVSGLLGAELRSISVEIEWVSKNLTFLKSARGIAPESVGARVRARVARVIQDANNLEHSTLLVEAAVVEENPDRGIPEGLLAYLTFQISPEAQPAEIGLRPKLQYAEQTGPPGRKLMRAEVEFGKVIVELSGLPPYVICFFFTH